MFRIEPYSIKRLAAYGELYKAVWSAEPYGELFTSEEIEQHRPANDGYLYLLVDEPSDQLIGFVGGRPLAHKCEFFVNESDPPVNMGSAFYIDELGVRDSYRKNGFGQTLMMFLMSCASGQFDEFVLRTHADENNPARKLYSKLAFSMRDTALGELHGVATTQARIDGRSETDRRLYYFKSAKAR